MGGLAMSVASGGRLGGARRQVDSDRFERLTPGQIQDCTKEGAEIVLGPSARVSDRRNQATTESA